MAEHGTLYNFGVLTKRYELVSRTAGQLAPGVLGAACGFVMILGSIPMPLPFVPVLLGFWFALGRVPFGRHRGTKVRSLVGSVRALRAPPCQRSGPLGDAPDLAGRRDQHGHRHCSDEHATDQRRHAPDRRRQHRSAADVEPTRDRQPPDRPKPEVGGRGRATRRASAPNSCHRSSVGSASRQAPSTGPRRAWWPNGWDAGGCSPRWSPCREATGSCSPVPTSRPPRSASGARC